MVDGDLGTVEGKKEEKVTFCDGDRELTSSVLG